jgi:hypothetical protein
MIHFTIRSINYNLENYFFKGCIDQDNQLVICNYIASNQSMIIIRFNLIKFKGS